MPDDEKQDAKKSLYWVAVTFVINLVLTIAITWYATSVVVDSTLVTPIYVMAGMSVFFFLVAASLIAAGAQKENDKFLFIGLCAFVVADLLWIALVSTIAALFIEQEFMSTTICIVIAVLIVLLSIGGLWLYWQRINSGREVLKRQ